ncbi:antibiotic biosynthesis monooxygenase family protein [Saccharothrix longispora]|uniref:antibiotic biosynthesis monooxygenase family protein n=1 Tax=Saccharothrix longispora TaxID=33920 RepID=UPI0028FD9305|nr:antibiotic biosynthesis monooxygenase family protein [Saccharothrix longispora]MBY8847749.1 antibiotic biosynthesis monooxygenase [Saccharothrix sp. MB29]MDU0287853.1 antibiotic biosynthesis monooxygenase family protein [Saccharothrix longispora]
MDPTPEFPTTDHLRVIFRLRAEPGAGPRLRDAYERIRHEVARVEGYLGDQLCQSAHDPDEWVITSEWVSPQHFATWEATAGHRALAAPLMACVTDRESRRYLVRATTRAPQRQEVGGTP